MALLKPIEIIGFTPLGVILAERFSYSFAEVSVVERVSSLITDTHWQSVSLFCLISLLKRCRMLMSDSSKKFGINIRSVKMNEQLVYSSLKLATRRVQKYYLTLLKQRQVTFEILDDRSKSDEKENDVFNLRELSIPSADRLLNNSDFIIPTLRKSWWQSTSNTSSFSGKDTSRYVTYGHSTNPDFDQSIRLNVFHAIFQRLLSYPSVKLIGHDIFAFELAHLLATLGHDQIYLYRMNPDERSLLPRSETNSTLVTLFQIFSKLVPKQLLEISSDVTERSRLHIIEQFHHFKLNLDAEGQLEYELFVESVMPTSRTSEESKNHKRTYLETFKQRTQESLIKFSTSDIHINTTTETHEEPLNQFPPSSTFFVLTDVITSNDKQTHSDTSPSLTLPRAIRTFNSTPGSLIENIYETLRTISNDKSIPRLTSIFLSVDQELCIMQSQVTRKRRNSSTVILERTNEFGKDEVRESPQHDLHRPVENLHDLYKIIQRPISQTGQLILHESQFFRNDALDLQSMILLFHPEEEIPTNELMFLLHHERNWHNMIVLPEWMTSKNNSQSNIIL